jgi:hypothetical protein
LQKPFASLRQNHAFVDAIEQGSPQPLFNIAQLMAERRLRQVQPLTRPGHASFFRNRHNQLQVSRLEHRYESFRLKVWMRIDHQNNENNELV